MARLLYEMIGDCYQCAHLPFSITDLMSAPRLTHAHVCVAKQALTLSPLRAFAGASDQNSHVTIQLAKSLSKSLKRVQTNSFVHTLNIVYR